jgi:outer membrane protein assembly factor BamB
MTRTSIRIPVAVRAAVLVSGVGFLAASASLSRADNWPSFRGTDGQSVSKEQGLPAEWGPQKNVRWRVELPGKSNGSPVVWGDRVFVAQAVEKDKRRTVMCFNRADGKLLWQSGVAYSDAESTHPDNPYCSGTPATDGERVVACFGSAGLYCYDFAGKELWHRDLGKLNHMFGNAISPVIVGDRVVVNFGPGEGARLVAVDKRTGATAWEAQPPKVDESEKSMSGPRMSGPAMLVLMSMGGADKNEDGTVTRDELVAEADRWFDKVDPQKNGKVTKEQFVERLGDAMTPPPGAPAGGPKPGPVVGPGLFAAADADKDGSLTRQELEALFGGWHAKWSTGKDESPDFNAMLDGINALLAPPKDGAGAAPAAGAPAGPAGPGGFGGAAGPGGSWSTPVVIRAGGRDELIVCFPNRLAAYDPKTGKPLWFARGLPDSTQSTPIWDEQAGVVVASGGDMSGGTMIAVRPGGDGDVTESRRAWRQTRMKGSIGTGIAHDGHVYSVTSDGFLLCNDSKTGNRLWQKRLESTGGKGSSWSSVLLAGGKLYVPNQSGDVFVLRAAPKFEVLETNSVDEPTNASLAASDGELFLRTDKALWCIGGKR